MTVGKEDESMAKKEPKIPGKIICRDCSGRGERPWATLVVRCETCNGTGKVSAGQSRA